MQRAALLRPPSLVASHLPSVKLQLQFSETWDACRFHNVFSAHFHIKSIKIVMEKSIRYISTYLAEIFAKMNMQCHLNCRDVSEIGWHGTVQAHRYDVVCSNASLWREETPENSFEFSECVSEFNAAWWTSDIREEQYGLEYPVPFDFVWATWAYFLGSN